MASFPKQPLSGADVVNFLGSFQGAAATFAEEHGRWSLWLPEFHPHEHPLTPASQVFFPVILRHEEQAFAIRFFYDCSTGKVRYYTSAIPEEIARLPEFENAISELFRHSLPVEPIRQRKLGRAERKGTTAVSQPPLPGKARAASVVSLADPVEAPAAEIVARVVAHTPLPLPVVPAVTTIDRPPVAVALPEPRTTMALVIPSPRGELIAEIQPDPRPDAIPAETVRHLRVEIGPRARSVMVAIILTLGGLGLAALGTYAYLRATEDPGVLHHRLQIEAMRLREGR